MKKRTLLLLCTVALMTLAAQGRDLWTVGGLTTEVDTLIYPHLAGPGVTCSKYDLPAIPLKVSVMEVDLTNPYIQFETCLGADRAVGNETPVSMATRNSWPGHEVVGATNGDFFMTSPALEVGIPVSGQVRRGELVSSTHNRACFALDAQRRPLIDRLQFSGQVQCGGTTFKLGLVNRLRQAYEDQADNQSILFTGSYGPATYDATTGTMVALRPAQGAFAWRPNGEERCIVDSVFTPTGSMPIAAERAILWLKGSYADYAASLSAGQEVTVTFSVTLSGQAMDLREVVGGSNHIIMRNGAVEDAWDERHPRTCVGFNADSTHVYFVVIDGRSRESLGSSLAETADIFRALGAVTAVNLDGGGSSCMLVNDEIINSPSDGPVRAVGNGCLLIASAPSTDTIGIISYEPRCYNISTAASLRFSVWGYNRYGVLKTRQLQGCTFSCDEQVGRFDADGTFTASTQPAQGYLYVSYGEVTARQAVNIVNGRWMLQDDSVVVDHAHPYRVRVVGVSGFSADAISPAALTWRSTDPDVCQVDSAGLVSAVANGETLVVGERGDYCDTLAVFVQNPVARVTTVENVPMLDPATWAFTQSGGKDRTITALDHGFQVDFTGVTSRNPYLKISKQVTLWGLPDTLRVRLAAGDLSLKTLKVLLQTARGERITLEQPFDTVAGEQVLDWPVDSFCDMAARSNYPLTLLYYYITYASPTPGADYSLRIPGLELVYDCLETVVPIGDVNGDGQITIADANVIISIILNGEDAADAAALARADVNGDGLVTIADANAVIALILAARPAHGRIYEMR